MVERDQLADHLFGPIPASFFVLLGQTIAAAGLVVLKVYDLVTSLDRVEQHVHAGRSLSRMLSRCRELLPERFVPDFAQRAESVIGGVEKYMDQRNAVVHNVWTLTRDGRIFGWRPAPLGKRDKPSASPGVKARAIRVR